MNELNLALEIVVVFGMLLFCNKFLGKEGVIAWVGIATVLANILTAKNATIFGLSTAIGTVLFASTFLATDILSEKYSEESAKKAVYIGLFSDIVLILCTQIALRYIPSEIDFAHVPMKELFSLNLRISVASAVMYFVANMADVYIFNKMKANGGRMWVRNNVSTILCNCLENFGFFALAYVGVFDIKTIVTIAVSTSIIEMLVAVCDTPFLYIATKGIKHGENRKTADKF